MEKYNKELFELGGKDHYINRYIKFIESCSYNEKDYTERHHYLPVALFPEFEKDKGNIIVLTGRQHYIAHYILAKAFGNKMWFAFNQMKRLGYKGALYEISRKYVAEQASLSNKGRTKTEKWLNEHSDRLKGTFVVRDKAGNQYRTNKDDPKVLAGEVVSYRIGYKHSEETRQRMSMNNGTKGKSPYHKDNHIIYINTVDEPIPEGYIFGPPPKIGENMRKRMQNSCWVTVKETGKYKRIQKELLDENIHIMGRVGFKGFKHINVNRLGIDHPNSVKNSSETRKKLSESIKKTKQANKEYYDNISRENLKKTRTHANQK